ncbi:hypothetical protein [Candidatus Puniceispirillum marinum]|uniref:Predicted membrane protein n=1 Tax=Puniceispirillum marinum (strain IMCC1322) TaxID=488538 RepID=D5BUH0_PUNMI|nr:hypothetical protein [Candidatus Puniceispirillum marinum]ADE39917.1 predicted membrane protein [Candidatus Puniceispirillum marinum IMCC1322]
MSLIVALKFFHYLSLFLAGGLGVANALLAKAHQKAQMPPAPPVQQTMMTLARLGLVAIVILWVTGIILTNQIYGSFNLGWAFHLKLLGATILLLVIAFLNFHLAMSAKKGIPPNPKIMNAIPYIARTSLAAILIGIAIVTTA